MHRKTDTEYVASYPTEKIRDGWYRAKPLPDEISRLCALHDYGILDTDHEACFDSVTSLVKNRMNVAFSLVSLIDEHRQWFKSSCGIDVKETERDLAFCSHALWQKEPFIVLDARHDHRFFDNPLVSDAPGIRFYAGVPLIDKNGFVLGTLCAIDTSPRESMLEKDVFLMQTLADIIVDEIVLHKANQDLHRHSEEKTAFLASISHDLRTPLNGIIGAGELLKSAPDPEQRDVYLQTIMQSSEALLTMINNILDLSRIESGLLEPLSEAVCLRTLVTDIAHMLSPSVSRKDITLITSVSPLIPECVQGDYSLLQRIIINFATNAIKFTPSGYITIDIAPYHASYPEDPRVVLSVKDTGVGIPQDSLDHIFSAFHQCSTGYERSEGVGLGLAICGSLADAMHGTLSVETEEGKGSVFSCMLPLPPDAQAVSPIRPAFTVGITGNRHALRDIIGCYLHTCGSRIIDDQDLDNFCHTDAIICCDDDLISVGSRCKERYPLIPLLAAGKELEKHHLSGIFHGALTGGHLCLDNLSDLIQHICQAPIDTPLVITQKDALSDNQTSLQSPELTGLRVLFAEDNDVNRMIIRVMLERMGCDVHAVCNGIEALDYLATHHVDVLLTDYDMPKMNGLDLSQSIRNLHTSYQSIPIIALTANAFQHNRKACQDAGMDGYISKPVKQQTLREALLPYALHAA